MRPVSLTLEGFTCYKERQELNLVALDLFAICGPTGAGKSSLLDAMVFALYGKVPRLRRGYTELISQGRTRMIVQLSFRVGAATYHVTRRVAGRGRPAHAILEDARGLLAEGMPAVTEKVERILRIPYDAFVQAVLLPQGEFARFLKGEPGERTRLLREILGHEVYDRMRELAERRRGALGGALAGLRRLVEEYAEATPETLEATRRALAAAEAAQRAASQRAEDARRAAAGARERYAACAELSRLGADLAALRAGDASAQADLARLQAAERAASILPQVMAAEEAARAVEQHRRAAASLEEARARAGRDREDAERQLARAAAAAGAIDGLVARISALDGLGATLEARRATQARLAQAEERLGALREQAQAIRTRVSALEERLAALRGQVAAAEQQLTHLGYDAAHDQRLERASPLAAALSERRLAAQAAAGEAARARAEQARLARAAARAAAAARTARAHYDELKRALEEAAAALEDGRRQHAAAHLRTTLTVGEPCPVCEQTVARRPRRRGAPALDALEKAHADLAGHARAAESRSRRADRDAAAAAAAARQAETQATRARQEADGLARRVAADEARLRELVADIVAASGPEPIEERVCAAAAAAAAGRRRHTEIQGALGSAREAYQAALAERAALGERRESLAEQLAAAEKDAGSLASELGALDARVRRVTTHPSPEQERSDLAAEVRRLTQALEIARERATRAATVLAGCEAQCRDARAALAASERRAAELAQAAARAARDAGFDGLAAARAAVLDPAAASALRERITAHAAARHRLEQRIAELEARLGGSRVTEEDLRAAEAAQHEAEQAERARVEEAARLKAETGRLAERVEKARELAGETAAVAREFELYRLLADDLRSGGFQSYVLEEAFAELAAGASTRLWAVTNRYTLEYTGGGALAVVDHDNAGQRRSADTLSGGETFLASLALALELSEQVRRRHHGVSLDSLFIDEGFSTLDAAALDSAAAAIESLRRDGRMVGVITHLAELADRLPARIEVEKRADGSRVQIRLG